MLRLARDRARALRAAHGLDGPPDDAALDALLAAEGLAVVERCPFRGRAREMYVGGVLGIRRGLPAGWVRWLKAHGLAHHLPHHGNHAYARAGLYLCQQQELEAELFAGALVLGAARVRALLAGDVGPPPRAGSPRRPPDVLTPARLPRPARRGSLRPGFLGSEKGPTTDASPSCGEYAGVGMAQGGRRSRERDSRA